MMLTPNMGNRVPEDRVWAADTGCFSPSGASSYTWEKYRSWLLRWQNEQGRCLFATAPDVVGNARATMNAALPILPLIRELGYRAALVAQDGLEDEVVPWDALDCLFVGGTTRWKLSETAHELMQEARGRGKWVHAGRVNSLRRLRQMELSGAHSADGTYVAFGGDKNARKVEGWMRQIQQQLPLWSSGGYVQLPDGIDRSTWRMTTLGDNE
jgi:hypothetical protein